MKSTAKLVSPDEFRKSFIRQPFQEELQADYFQIVRVEQVAPFLQVPTLLHRTTYNYLVFLTQGEGRQVHNLDELVIDPMHILLVRAGTITAIQTISSTVAGFFIGFDHSLLEKLLSPAQLHQWHMLPAQLHLTVDEANWCTRLCDLVISEKKPPQETLTETGRYLLAGLIVKLLPKADFTSTSINREEQITTRFRQLVYEQIIQHKELHYYADRLAVSENYLFRCVKTVTGKSPKTMLLETLVLYAMVQLQQTTHDISQIAYDLAVDDPSYFGRLFKKFTGFTPSQYRESVQDLSE